MRVIRLYEQFDTDDDPWGEDVGPKYDIFIQIKWYDDDYFDMHLIEGLSKTTMVDYPFRIKVTSKSGLSDCFSRIIEYTTYQNALERLSRSSSNFDILKMTPKVSKSESEKIFCDLYSDISKGVLRHLNDLKKEISNKIEYFNNEKNKHIFE